MLTEAYDRDLFFEWVEEEWLQEQEPSDGPDPNDPYWVWCDRMIAAQVWEEEGDHDDC